MTQAPVRALYSAMNDRMRRCMATSSPMVGSSRNSTAGVQQRAGDLALHPLAQAEVAYGLAQQILQLQQFNQFVQPYTELGRRNAEDRLVKPEGVEHRDVPVQLVALTHDQRHSAQVVAVPPPRGIAE